MPEYYLAVDIGASSGRHILGHIENGKLQLEEIYRFANQMTNKDGSLLWDTERLFSEIIAGMKECKKLNKIPKSMAIDTWAVDYVLLDEGECVLGETYGYRDSRTAGMDKEVYKIIPETELYGKTGIQKQIFNTVYQLTAVKHNNPEYLKKAKTFLMLPDYFQFLLTGTKKSEYTNATSTQLVSPETKQWDRELIKNLGLTEEMFLPLTAAGTVVGNLKESIKKEVGFDLTVLQCAGHDTASAVMAVPNPDGDALYISSGTWSLMGTETANAVINEESRKANFTNEGGYDYRFRYLKNIMGLWMIQSVRHETGDAYSFAELCNMAEECKDFPSRVDVNDDMFLAPASMCDAVKQYCENTNQAVPDTIGEISTVIYRSLADSYGKTVREIEKNTGKTYNAINIIGGGANADYLNRLTADATAKTVLAGPTEATAIGNLLAQLIKDGALKDLKTARKCVLNSFEIKKYLPKGAE